MARTYVETNQPGIYLRLLGTWGLGLAGLPSSLVEGPQRCLLRPPRAQVAGVQEQVLPADGIAAPLPGWTA